MYREKFIQLAVKSTPLTRITRTGLAGIRRQSVAQKRAVRLKNNYLVKLQCANLEKIQKPKMNWGLSSLADGTSLMQRKR